MSVMFKPGRRKMLVEATDTDSSVLDSFYDFPDLTVDISIVEDKIVEEDVPSDLRDLMSKDSRRTSALQHVQELCRTHSLSLLSAVRSVE